MKNIQAAIFKLKFGRADDDDDVYADTNTKWQIFQAAIFSYASSSTPHPRQ